MEGFTILLSYVLVLLVAISAITILLLPSTFDCYVPISAMEVEELCLYHTATTSV
jgi:uncharacterized membrane protein YccF (DUF307 family)